MTFSRWKMLAGVLSVSLGGLATVAGQCPKTDDSKGSKTPISADVPAGPALPSNPVPMPKMADSAPSLPTPDVGLPGTPLVPGGPALAPPSQVPGGDVPVLIPSPVTQNKKADAGPMMPVIPAAGYNPQPTPQNPTTTAPPSSQATIPLPSPQILPQPAPTAPQSTPAASTTVSRPAATSTGPSSPLPAGAVVGEPVTAPATPPDITAPVQGSGTAPVSPPKVSSNDIPSSSTGSSPLTGYPSSSTGYTPSTGYPSSSTGSPPNSLPSTSPKVQTVMPASATSTSSSRFRIVLRVGEGDPTFEVRTGDDLVLKVVCEKVDVKSPEKGPGLSSVKASGKVHFAGFGAEGTCEELSFLAGSGEVSLTGNVKISVKDKLGRVESELSTENVKYKIDASAIGGTLRP